MLCSKTKGVTICRRRTAASRFRSVPADSFDVPFTPKLVLSAAVAQQNVSQRPRMLATSRKDRLPREMSYPARSRTLSEALGDVPQSPELRVRFGLSQPLCKKGGREKRYLVLQVSYWGTTMPPELRWGLLVLSVPRDACHEIQELLAAEGFGRVKRWLQLNGDLKHTAKRLSVLYNETEKRLTYNETIG
jgi:hypothetical protein